MGFYEMLKASDVSVDVVDKSTIDVKFTRKGSPQSMPSVSGNTGGTGTGGSGNGGSTPTPIVCVPTGFSYNYPEPTPEPIFCIPTSLSYTHTGSGNGSGDNGGGNNQPPVLSEFDLNPVTTVSTSFSLRRDVEFVTSLKVASSPGNIASEFIEKAPTLRRLIDIVKAKHDVNPAVPENTSTATYTFSHSFIEILDKDLKVVYADGTVGEDNELHYFDELQIFEDNITNAINPISGASSTPGERDICLMSGNVIIIEDELGTRYAVSYSFLDYVGVYATFPRPLYKGRVSVGANYDQAYFALKESPSISIL
jgi:hypothetical protein